MDWSSIDSMGEQQNQQQHRQQLGKTNEGSSTPSSPPAVVLAALPQNAPVMEHVRTTSNKNPFVEDGGSGCEKLEIEKKGRVQEHHHDNALFNAFRGSSRMDDCDHFNHNDDHDKKDSVYRGASACSTTTTVSNIFDDDAYNEFLRSVGREGEAGEESSPFIRYKFS